MTQANTDFGRIADDLRRAATSFALLTSSASAFGSSLQAFREFEKQLVLTNAIAGGTVEQLNRMSEAARNFSLVTTVSAVEAGAALQQLAQAGFTAEESLAAMTGVLLLAQATLSDVRLTADVVSSNIRAFGLAASETTRIANVFSAAITGSLATMDKLAFALRQVAPVAELAGLSIEETTAALGVLFNIGLRGEQAGTALRNIIIRLVRPLGEAGNLLREAGIATRTATGEFRNLAEILTDIGNSDLSDAQLAQIFETEALAGAKAFIRALQTLNSEGVNQYEQLRDAITDTDRAVELAAANLETFDGALTLFQNNIADISKDIGELLAEQIIRLTDFITGLIEAFRGLDEGTQRLILQYAGYAAATVGVLATTNALFVLFRSLALTSIPTLISGLGTLITLLTGFGAAILTAALPALTAIGAVAASLATQLAGLVIGFNAAAGAALLFGPAAPAVIGFGILAAGATALAFALDAAVISAEELEAALNLENDAFKIAATTAQDSADAILGVGLENEIKARVNAINRQLDVLRFASPEDRAGFAGRAQGRVETEVSRVDEQIAALDAEFAEAKRFFDRRAELQAQIDEQIAIVQNSESRAEQRAAAQRKFSLTDQLNDFVLSLTDEERGSFTTYKDNRDALLALQQENLDTIVELQNVETAGVRDFLVNISNGEATLAQEYAEAAAIIQRSGVLNQTGIIEAIAQAVSTGEGAATTEDILRAALEQTNLSSDEIIALLTVRQQTINNELLSGLQSIASELDADLEDVRIELLKQELDRSTEVSEAIRIANELGAAKLQQDLDKVRDDLTKLFDDVLVDFGIDFRDGVQEVLENALIDADIDYAGSIPGFSEVVSGAAFINAVNDQIDASTSQEDAAAIIAAEKLKYQKIMIAYVAALAEASAISEDQAALIRTNAEASIALAESEFLAGLGAQADLVDDAVDRVNRQNNSRTGASNKSAENALKAAREIEDAFAEIERANLDVSQSIFESTRGLNLAVREAFLADFAFEDINLRYDEEIRKLQRNLQDVTTNFKGSSTELQALTDGYTQLIERTEQARDAEIAASSSFSEQMARRSDAIDLFIRDIEDIAMQSESAFAQFGGGIATAFAGYQKELISVLDITRDATTSTLEAINNGINDFIFDTENAWENFKSTMLDISRQIFAGFTENLLQQGISSLTGGGGSLLGNAISPGALGGEANQQTPGVGDNFLGRLLGGLGIGGGGQAGGGTEALGGVLSADAAATQTLYQTHLQAQQTTFSTFNTQLQAALTQVTSNISTQAVAPAAVAAPPAIDVSPFNVAMQAAATQFQAYFSAFGTTLQTSMTTFTTTLQSSFTAIVTSFNLMATQAAAAAARQQAQQVASSLGGAGIPFATGGLVTGPGTGTSDSIPAMLSNKEFVVNAKATADFLPLLAAINGGKSVEEVASLFTGSFAKFATGGLVGGLTPDLTSPVAVPLMRPSTSLGGGSQSNSAGSSITLNVTYNISGAAQAEVDSMRKSSSQHAKALASALERAKRNT